MKKLKWNIKYVKINLIVANNIVLVVNILQELNKMLKQCNEYLLLLEA